MKKSLMALLVLGGLLSAVAPVQAFGRKQCKDDCCAPACTTCEKWVDKTVTCYKTEWRERDVTYTVNKLVSREEVVPVKRTVMVPEWKEEKRVVNCPKWVDRMVEREVTCWQTVQTCEVDPCTGCSRMVCRRVPVVKKVPCCVRECVMEQKEITVKVCTCKAVEETVQCRRVVCEVKPEQVTCKQRYCVTVPYQTTMKVRVCEPCCQ